MGYLKNKIISIRKLTTLSILVSLQYDLLVALYLFSVSLFFIIIKAILESDIALKNQTVK